MQLQFPPISIETSEKFLTEAFSLGDQRVIMTLLRSKLYSAPIRTLCQEVMSNARDAHREVGKADLPIEVTLPSNLEPTLRIRDFGPGITPERMRDVFIKYGVSTKRADDVQTGGFGLGAKSPFSYTDSFTVVTITPEDGRLMRREYVAYIDETQIGAMSLVKECQTEDPQGTLIIVPCKPGDKHKFDDAVREVSYWWNPRPVVRGHGFNWPNLSIYLEGNDKDWSIADDCSFSGSAKVLLDGIPYRVQLDQLYGDEIPAAVVQVTRFSLRLFFKSGELRVTANREDLDYQPDVIAALKARLTKVESDVKTFLKVAVDKATTYTDACLIWSKLSDRFNFIPQTHSWNGFELRRGFDLSSFNMLSVTTSYRDKTKRRDRYDGQTIYITEKTLIVDNDMGSVRPAQSRISTLFDQHPQIDRVMVLSKRKPELKYCSGCCGKTQPASWKQGDNCTQCKPDDAEFKQLKADIKRLEDMFKWSKLGFVTLSSVPQKVLPRKQGYKLAKAKVYSPTGASLIAAEIDPEDAGLYVELFNNKGWIDRKREILMQSNAFHLLGDKKVYGIVPHFIPKLGPKWVSVASKLSKMQADLMSDQAVQEMLNECPAYIGRYIDIKKILPKLTDQDGVCARLMRLMSTYFAVEDKIKKVMLINNILGTQCKTTGSKMKDLQKVFEEQYPLIAHNSNVVYWLDDVVTYVNAKDAVLKSKS